MKLWLFLTTFNTLNQVYLFESNDWNHSGKVHGLKPFRSYRATLKQRPKGATDERRSYWTDTLEFSFNTSARGTCLGPTSCNCSKFYLTTKLTTPCPGDLVEVNILIPVTAKPCVLDFSTTKGRESNPLPFIVFDWLQHPGFPGSTHQATKSWREAETSLTTKLSGTEES